MNTPKNATRLGVIAIFIALVAFVVTACDKSPANPGAIASSTLEHVISTKKVRAAYIVYPPTVAVKEKADQPSGFLIDIMNEIAKQANLEVSYEPTTFDDLKLAINSGKYDVIVGGVFVNVSRAREFALTEPIMFWAGTAAITTSSHANEFGSLDDLNKPGITIAVTAGTAEHDFVKRNLPNAKINAVPNSDIALTLSEVTAGRADVAFADAITIRKFIQDKPKLISLFGGRQFNTFGASFVVRQGQQDWLNFLNASISALQWDGTIDKLSKKYGGDSIWMLPKRPWE